MLIYKNGLMVKILIMAFGDQSAKLFFGLQNH